MREEIAHLRVVAMKPTTITNNNIVFQPVILSDFGTCVASFNELVTLELLVQQGITGFYDNLFKKLFLNKDKSLKIKCVNKRKQIFEYRHEGGSLIRDEKLQQFIKDYVRHFQPMLRVLSWDITSAKMSHPSQMKEAVWLRLPRPTFPSFVANTV